MAFPTERKARKKQILSGFFDFQNIERCLKKPEFQNLASKTPNWQP